MTKNEWLEIGFSKNIIDVTLDDCPYTFSDIYLKWFLMKMKKIKPQSLDRLECTYRRWFLDIASVSLYSFTEKYCADFLNRIIIDYSITQKEYKRIYQILNNVLVYAYDMGFYHSCVNFDIVKKYVAIEKLSPVSSEYVPIKYDDMALMIKSVVNDRIYPDKQCECLLWCMNYFLGLRIGELSSLRFSDFDLSARLVHVRHTQTKYHNRDDNGERTGTMSYDIEDGCKTDNSIRDVPLCDNAIKLYHLILRENISRGYNCDYLAYDGKEVIYTRSMARCLARLQELTGLQHTPSHTIRKTVATCLHNNNTPTRIISDILGHSMTSTTEKYYILSTKDYSAYIDYMNKSFVNYYCRN